MQNEVHSILSVNTGRKAWGCAPLNPLCSHHRCQHRGPLQLAENKTDSGSEYDCSGSFSRPVLGASNPTVLKIIVLIPCALSSYFLRLAHAFGGYLSQTTKLYSELRHDACRERIFAWRDSPRVPQSKRGPTFLGHFSLLSATRRTLGLAMGVIRVPRSSGQRFPFAVKVINVRPSW